MHLRSVEALFARYRKRGDAGSLAEVFDRTAPELFRLAQHLVRDPLAAEDVLQETFVAAIDAAARWDDERALVPWLTGILARKASEARRRERREPELARLREVQSEDPADAAAQSEFSGELRSALAGLPELYREVLERHLFDGARPAEIARDLARAPGTVRMQIHRGLEQLRRLLPAGFAAGAALAALAPRGLASVREAVLAHAAAAAALTSAGVVGVAGAGLGPFGLAALAALLALCAVPLAWYFARATPASPGVPIGPSADPVDFAAAPRAVPRSLPAVEREAEPARSTVRAVPRLVLRGRVLGPSADELGAVALEVRGVARYDWPDGRSACGVPAADGTFEIALDDLLAVARERGALDEFELRADHPDWLPVALRLAPADAAPADADGAEIELRTEVSLRRALILEGRVERPWASALPIHVGALPCVDGAPEARWLDRTVARADGSFRLRLAEAGEIDLVASADDALTDQARLWVPSGAVNLRLEPGVRLEGRWRNGLGPAPFSAFRLQLERAGATPPHVRLGERDLVWLEGRWGADGVEVHLDESGTFAAQGLAFGAHVASPHFAAGAPAPFPYKDCQRQVELFVAFERREFDLGMGTLAIQVRDAAGRPRSGGVGVVVGEWTGMWQSDAAGSLTLLVVAGREVGLRAAQEGGEGLERRVVAPPAGEQVVVELRAQADSALPRARVRIERDDGQPIEGEITLTVRETAADAPIGVHRLAAQADGALWLSDLPEGELALELFSGAAHRHYQDFWLPARCTVTTLRGQRADADFDLRRGGRLRIAARDGGGLALPATCRIRDLYGVAQDVRFLLRGPELQGFTEGGQLSVDGPVDAYPNLPAGLYELEFEYPGAAPRRVHARVTAGAVSEVEVHLP